MCLTAWLKRLIAQNCLFLVMQSTPSCSPHCCFRNVVMCFLCVRQRFAGVNGALRCSNWLLHFVVLICLCIGSQPRMLPADFQQVATNWNALLDALSAGSLPATLPANFSQVPSNKDTIPLNVLYLSNNNFTGALPASWGNSTTGWSSFMQRLALDGNQLTGTLPQVWSDSKSLSSLGKLNLVGNQLTGSIPWSTANMPDLLNLIVLPGKHQRLRCVSA